jgi:hypothetical protein
LLIRAHRNGTVSVTAQPTRNAIYEAVLGARALDLRLREYHHGFVLLNLGMELSGFFHAGLHAS